MGWEGDQKRKERDRQTSADDDIVVGLAVEGREVGEGEV